MIPASLGKRTFLTSLRDWGEENKQESAFPELAPGADVAVAEFDEEDGAIELIGPPVARFTLGYDSSVVCVNFDCTNIVVAFIRFQPPSGRKPKVVGTLFE